MKTIHTLGFLLACAGGLVVGGCYKHTYTAGTGGNLDADPAYSAWHAHWLFGIIGDENVEINKICPSGNVSITNKITFVNGLIGALVGVIYYPTTVQVFCGAGGGAPAKAATLEIPVAQMRKLARDPRVQAFVRSVSDAKARELTEAIALDDSRQVGVQVSR